MMTLPTEFTSALGQLQAQEAARQSAAIDLAHGAALERQGRIDVYNSAIEAAKVLGPLAASHLIAYDVVFSEQAPVAVGPHRNIRVPQEIRFKAPTAIVHDVITDTEGWHMGSVSGKYPGAPALGKIGATLTPAGVLLGYRTWRFDKPNGAPKPPHYGFGTNDATAFAPFRLGERGLQEQENIAFDTIRDRAVYGTFGPQDVFDSLVSFAAKHRLV